MEVSGKIKIPDIQNIHPTYITETEHMEAIQIVMQKIIELISSDGED